MNDIVVVPERTSDVLYAGLQNGAVDFFQDLWGPLQKVEKRVGRIALMM